MILDEIKKYLNCVKNNVVYTNENNNRIFIENIITFLNNKVLKSSSYKIKRTIYYGYDESEIIFKCLAYKPDIISINKEFIESNHNIFCVFNDEETLELLSFWIKRRLTNQSLAIDYTDFIDFPNEFYNKRRIIKDTRWD